MLKTLILLVIFVTSGCGGSFQENISSPTIAPNAGETTNMKQKATNICRSDLKERLKSFYSKVPDNFRDVAEDAKFISELKQCPREEAISSLIALRDSNAKDIEIKAKTAFLLIKLNADEKNNKKELLSAYTSFQQRGESNFKFGIDYIVDMISGVISNDDPDADFLSEAFELEANGAAATMLGGTFVNVFEANPESFLRKLKEKPKKIRERTYSGMCFALSAGELAKMLTSIPADSNNNPAANEMRQFIEQNKGCQ